MNKKKLCVLLLGSFVFVLLLGIGNPSLVKAKSATAISLKSFEATALDNAVLLEWETGTELSTAGFKLKRSKAGESSDYLKNPDTGADLFIVSEGSPSIGATYEFTDNTAVNNNTYTYILVELETSGNETEAAEDTVVVGVVPSATPITIHNSTSVSQPTATTAPATATATTAASNNPTATAVPANTSSPTATTATQTQATATPQASKTPAPVGGNQNEPTATATQPTATTAAVEVQEITSDTNIAVAQAQEETDESAAVDGSSANAAVPLASVGQVENEAVAGTIGESGTENTTAANEDNPVAIGSEPILQQSTGNDANPAPEAQEEAENSNGRTYLWVGFLVALLVFGGAIVGAILLYTRKQNPGA